MNNNATTDRVSHRLGLPLAGRCHCGSIRYRITGYPRLLYACHCTNRQCHSGSAFALNMLVPITVFHILQGEPKAWQRRSPAGAETTSWFCGDCACRIHGSRPTRPATVTVRAGSLDDTSWLTPAAHMFVRSAQPWMNLPNAACFDEAPPDFAPIAAAWRAYMGL